MTHKNSLGRLLLFIVVGLILGGILSEALGALFGELGVLLNAGGYDNIVHDFFTAGPDFSIGFSGDTPQPVVVDLYFVKFALGFGVKGNALGVVGMGLAIYIMKWSGER